MRVWLIEYGEPLPLENSDRLQRTGTLARTLVNRGHEVVWWTSTFEQYQKRHLYDRDTVRRPSATMEIRLLHTRGYRRHVSLTRLYDHIQLGVKFRRQCTGAPKPDVIYCALPTLELSDAAVRYGKRFGVPVVIDVRDWWPDIFVDVTPKMLRPVARVALAPMFRMARRACAGATTIMGITPEFVEWGLAKAGRRATPWDRSFPFGYSAVPLPDAQLAEAREFWRKQGIAENGGRFVVCFFGSIGKSFDLRAVARAARQLRQQNPQVLFAVCGKGDRLEDLRTEAAGLDNIVLPGWVGAAQIYTLMRLSSVGLDPLPERGDFLASINNKATEYLSAGLPIISSPKQGALFNLLQQQRCGCSFAAGDSAELAAVVSTLASNPTVVEDMAQRAKALFRSTFDADKVYKEMGDYFEQVAVHFGHPQPSRL